MTIAIAIYLFPNAEVLDFAGPYEVFTTASRVFQRNNPAQPLPFSVFTVAQARATVQARAGLVVHPDYGFASHPPVDVLLIAGGVVDAELAKPDVVRWIAAQSQQSELTASVCTGAFLLAEAGLLQGVSATTHWEDIAALRERYPAVTVVAGPRWVDEGKIVTSAGISAGIDMSLHLVERLVSRELALLTAKQMDVVWNENVG
jgi:transcriptional regulator GlxA family with amidase domain